MRRGRFRADDAGPLNEPVHLPSVLVTTVLEHLEAGGVPQNVCDQVVKIIEKWELSQTPQTENAAGEHGSGADSPAQPRA